jgi:hypothetical protein
MRFIRIARLAFVAIPVVAAVAQEAMSNESVIKMVRSGLGEELVIGLIQAQPGKYVLDPDEFVRLKQAGVSEKILSEMLGRGARTQNGQTAPEIQTAIPGLPQNLDAGVYYRSGYAWEEMLPEVVNWKTGGLLKRVASAGIVKGDVNGNISGPHSRNSIKSPIDVLICLREGVSITEYQLVRLRENSDYREFRTVTGGVLHESGGVTRDLVPLESKKVGNRIYKVVLPSLGSGEYGFLPPEAISLSKGASIGKMHTFRVVE